MNLRCEKKLFLTPKKSCLLVDNLTFGANNSERAGNEGISWHLSSGLDVVSYERTWERGCCIA